MASHGVCLSSDWHLPHWRDIKPVRRARVEYGDTSTRKRNEHTASFETLCIDKKKTYFYNFEAMGTSLILRPLLTANPSLQGVLELVYFFACFSFYFTFFPSPCGRNFAQ
jgi:hypothetical protein